MATDDRFGSTQSQTGQSQTGQGQTGTTPGTARSAEYDDGLTVQDTTHGAEPRTETSPPGASSFAATRGTGDRDLGDNRDGLGRDRTDDVTADESGTLISADKVVGTAVYDASGERLGTIDSIMLNKRSGKVAYAVMSFGGFLGIGERYHPLPWDVLTYDNDKGGYNIEHSADDLRKAPNYTRDEVGDFDYGARTSEVDSYYGVDVGKRMVTDQGDSPYRGGSVDAEPGDELGVGHVSADTTRTDDSTRYGAVGTGVTSADAVGATTGAGSSGMASTGMGANRNF